MEKFKPFDSAVDYMTLHIEWADKHKSFKPKDFNSKMYNSYKEELVALYLGNDKVIKSQRTAYTLMKMDLQYMYTLRDVDTKVNEIFGIEPVVELTSFFVTFNIDPKKFDAQKLIKAIESLKIKDWVAGFYGVMEYYGEKSNHPHLMCKISVADKYKKWGKFKDKMKQTIIFRNFMAGDNFLEVKKFESYHDDYLALDKSPKKQESLDKDIIWRNENSIPHFFEK